MAKTRTISKIDTEYAIYRAQGALDAGSDLLYELNRTRNNDRIADTIRAMQQAREDLNHALAAVGTAFTEVPRG